MICEWLKMNMTIFEYENACSFLFYFMILWLIKNKLKREQVMSKNSLHSPNRYT